MFDCPFTKKVTSWVNLFTGVTNISKVARIGSRNNTNKYLNIEDCNTTSKERDIYKTILMKAGFLSTENE